MEEISKNMNQDDIAQLVSQGALHLPNDENDKKSKLKAEIEIECANKNQSLLDYIINEYSKHENFGDVFSINFLSFKPPKNLDNFASIPNIINFKFSFWDFEEFFTEPCVISKPSELKVSYISAPPSFFLYKLNTDIYTDQSEKEMKINITYDPSIDNYIDYKDFLSYLLMREIFIEIFDYEKQIPYGYIKLPLKKFLRIKKKSTLENFSVNIFDNYSFEQKGSIELVLKSQEIKTIKEFNLFEQDEKLNYFYSCNQYIRNDGTIYRNKKYDKNKNIANTQRKKKKVVCVEPMNFNKLTTTEKEIYAKKISDTKNLTNNITGGIDDKNKFLLDKNTEKRIRVLRFLDNHEDDGKILTSNIKTGNTLDFGTKFLTDKDKNLIQEENNFYNTLNYVNYIKNLNKETIIEKTIADNNQNILNIALIQGEPHYFNFILSNDTNIQQLYHIIISKTKEKDEDYESDTNSYNSFDKIYWNETKNENSRNFKDNIVYLVSDSKEYEFITILKGLKIPNDHNYDCVSKDGHVIVQPHQSVPLLFKCLSYKCLNGYDDNSQSKYNIFFYNQSNIPEYFMSINIIKVFPIVDFEFYYNVEEKKLSKIKFINPFKFNTERSKELLKTHHFLNGLDKNSDINIKLDPLSNDFFFNFNNLTNLAENQIIPNSPEIDYIYNNKKVNNDVSKNNNKRLLFFYRDIYKAQLLSTFNFYINAYDCINLCTDLGVKKTNKLLLPVVDVPRTIKLYSSNESILFFKDRYKENIVMVPNMRYEVEYIVYTKKSEIYDLLLSCVDITTKDIIKTWLIKCVPNNPKINQIIKVDCLIGTTKQVKFSFTSPLNTWCLINFESSNRAMVELSADQMTFNPEETKLVAINICKSNIAGRSTSYVFISDNDNLFNQTVQVDICYY